MTTEQFKRKAERLRVKARTMAIVSGVVFIVALALFAYEYTKLPNPLSRAGIILLAAGYLYVLLKAQRQLRLPLTPETFAATGLEAYKTELERSRDRMKRAWTAAPPLLPGAIVFAIPAVAPLMRAALENPRVALMNVLPFSILLGVWLVFMLPVRRRRLRKMQTEIDSLNRLAQ